MDQQAMTPETIIELLDRAEAEFRAESTDIELMANTTELQRDEMGEMDSSGQHPADVASETVEREIALGIRLEAADVLNEIAAARDRLARGVYGRCEVCGSDIHPERLEMVPWARRCAADEAHREAEWRAVPSEEQPPLWLDETPEPLGAREGSSWDPEDDHPTDSTEEAALHELRGGT